jgi:hypothetical protein
MKKALGFAGTDIDPFTYLAENTSVFSYPGWPGSINVQNDMKAALTTAFDNTKAQGGSIPPLGAGGGSLNFRFIDNTLALSKHALGLAVDFDPANNGVYSLSEYARTNPDFNNYLDRNMGIAQDQVKGYDANMKLAELYRVYQDVVLMQLEALDSSVVSSSNPGGDRYSDTFYQGLLNLQRVGEKYVELIESPELIPKLYFSMDKTFVETMRRSFTWGGDWPNKKDYMHFER